jgi:hypothetical protein
MMEDNLTATAYLLAPAEGERRGEIVGGVVKGMFFWTRREEGVWMSPAGVIGACMVLEQS